MAAPLVRMQGIAKRYGGVQALRGVDFEVRSGEIVCLLGENGAGKSTLMKILAGAVTGYEGEILMDGAPLRLKDTAQAMKAGIGVVFQEFNLCPNLSAVENLFLGREPRVGLGGLGRAAMRKGALKAFADLELDLDMDLAVGKLGMARQQMVEIAKALSQKPRVLILDEPSSALSSHEIAQLFRVLKALRASGLGIIYISHKLSEIRELCDRVVCLRDGQNAGEVDPRTCSEDDLVAMMVGRVLEPTKAGNRSVPSGASLLSVKGLSGPPNLSDISFELRAGEVLGLAGLMGAGRTELARLLIGAVPRSNGRVEIQGRELFPKDPSQAVAAGMAYVPEDRKTQGIIRGLSVSEHSSLSAPSRVAGRLGFFRPGRRSALSRYYIRRLRIKARPDQSALDLSGGNQQKVVLARCLATRPKVLILDEPTRGIDVGAKAEVHRLILEWAGRGLGVLLISSELPEILGLCDRVLVMHEGRLNAELRGEDLTEEAILKAAVGSEAGNTLKTYR
ncbi:MAG: sugar ABC transporter ATP-binding protein [candidate division FCPU426 bacterium]